MAISAYEEAVLAVSLNAAADFSGTSEGIYSFVKVTRSNDGNGEFNLAGAGERAIAVLLTKPPQGQPGRLGVHGIVPIRLGGTVQAGGEISVGANGRGVAQSSTNPSYAVALSDGANGDLIPALLLAQR